MARQVKNPGKRKGPDNIEVHRELKVPADCRRCPRLVQHRRAIQSTHPDYFNQPVPAWGDRSARVLVIGLAPGLHGAHRTGRAFVGDASGDLLFEALANNGFASHSDPSQARLQGLLLTNAVKCLPPANAPTGIEVTACQPYLAAELMALCPRRARKPRCIVALGGVAYRALQRALGVKLAPFAHGQETMLQNNTHVIASFHPSRLNVNTGRINLAMLNTIFARARTLHNA